MFPDLENPFMALLFGSQVSNQMVLHSLLGSATIGTFIAVIVTVRVYPPLVGRLFNVDREKVENKCKLSFLFVLSVFISIISHVLLDVTNHPYNGFILVVPFRQRNGQPIYFAFGYLLGGCGCRS
jgi:hypothetical protein